MTKTISINRAPVLTLWAAVVAERLGFSQDEALSLAKAVAGLNAQSKGRRLGIYSEGKDEDEKPRPKKEPEAVQYIELMGRGIPAVITSNGLRASIKGEMVEPEAVQRYLEKKFGESLAEARAAMEKLARAHAPRKLAADAYPLYEKFRPTIPGGKKGWGAKGTLDLEYILSLAH